jgi:hypothetical protein
MSIDNDNESRTSNTNSFAASPTRAPFDRVESAISTEKQKKVMKKICDIKESDEMKLYVSNHQYIINSIPTKLLNSWNHIQGFKFVRRSGYIYYSVFNSGSAEAVKALRDENTKLSARLDQLKDVVVKIINVLNTNNIQLEI